MNAIEARKDPSLLSIVIPVYNEEACLPMLRNSIKGWVATREYVIEVILIDDGSRDGSRQFLQGWALEDARIKVIFLSRNFGQQLAITAGLHASSGDAIAIMDADLQDPLEAIPDMLAKYREGYDVIYGKRKFREGETFVKKSTAWLFYRFLRLFSGMDIPTDTGDFRIISRRFLDSMLTMNETHRFLRGMMAWVGFSQIAVEYDRAARVSGVTKFNFSKMLRFAVDGVISFSVLPIRLIAVAGCLVSTFGATYGVYSILRALVVGDTVRGWPTIVVLICLMGGMILMSLGIIGEYVARIYEETKRRPLYVVEQTYNLEK